jgi:hypothetical protein
LFVTFQVCLLLCLGNITAKAGMWVAILFFGSTLINLILGTLGYNQYNPYALPTHALSFPTDLVDASVSIGVAITLCFISAVAAATVFRKKKLA